MILSEPRARMRQTSVSAGRQPVGEFHAGWIFRGGANIAATHEIGVSRPTKKKTKYRLPFPTGIINAVDRVIVSLHIPTRLILASLRVS